MIARGRFGAGLAVLAAVMAIAAAVAVAAVMPVAIAAATPGPAVPTEPRNEIVAKLDALTLLGRLVLPPDATRSEHEPAGDGGTLAHAFSGPPATPNAVDYHAWWVLSDSPAAVLQYIQAHPPSGARPGLSGMGEGGGQPSVSAIGFTWPPIARRLSTRSLVVEVVALADGSTGVRADSEVVWITLRPASEHIPSGARRLVITVTRFGRMIQRPLTVSSPAALRRVVALLNGLPAAQPGTTACPADSGSLIRLALYRGAATGAAPLAVAVVDPSGCGVVRLTIGGRREPPLAGGVALARRLSRVIGVKIKTGVGVP